MAQANYETRNAPTLEEGGEPMVTKAIDDFIAYMCDDETVKVTDMLIMVSPKDLTPNQRLGIRTLSEATPREDTSKQMNIDSAETAKLLQQLYTEMLVERIIEKGLDYLLRR